MSALFFGRMLEQSPLVGPAVGEPLAQHHKDPPEQTLDNFGTGALDPSKPEAVGFGPRLVEVAPNWSTLGKVWQSLAQIPKSGVNLGPNVGEATPSLGSTSGKIRSKSRQVRSDPGQACDGSSRLR